MLFNRFVPVDEATGFYTKEIAQSCRFNDNDSAYLYKTPAGAGDRQKFTFSTWPKRGNLGLVNYLFSAGSGAATTSRFGIFFDASDRIVVGSYGVDYVTSTDVFRDPTGHFHLLVAVDSTDGTGLDRVKVYINNRRITAGTFSSMALNLQNAVTDAVVHCIGRREATGASYFDGYQSETFLIDGQALTPSDFGESKSGIWIPKTYTGSYGTNGFRLNYADSADLGNDVSGNANDFTSSGLTSDDQVLDSPTNNYCVFNRLLLGGASVNSLSDGNLKATTGASTFYMEVGTFVIPSTGKWVFEGIPTTAYGGIGIVEVQHNGRFNEAIARAAGAWGYSYYGYSGNLVYGNTNTTKAYGATYTNADVIRVEVDMDALEIEFFKNNVSQGVESISADYEYQFAICDHSSGNFCTWDCDFGQKGFTHTPTAGFLALCSENMDDPTIEDSSAGLEIVEWTGNATDDRNLGAANFDVTQGALLIVKNKAAAKNWLIYDTVRGAGQVLHFNDGDAEVTENGNILQAFITAGFQIGDTDPGLNDNSNNYAAWILRAAAAYGLDIVSYAGTGVAHAINHSLGVVPELIITKNRNTGARSWGVYHHHALNKTDPETDAGFIDLNQAWTDNVTYWNDVAPTSSQFTVGTSAYMNANGDNYIAYLFASIPGFLKVFSFSGNGNADGPFIHLDFRPRFIIFKRASGAAGNWVLLDMERSVFNPMDDYVEPDTTDGEASGAYAIDMAALGVKLRATNAAYNASGAPIVGIAIADQPGKYANAM